MKTRIFTSIILSACLHFSYGQNVGIGTNSPGSKLTVNGSFAAGYITDAITPKTLGVTNYYYAYSGSVAGIVNLPAAISGAGNFGGRIYHIKNTGSSTLAITANGAELIDNQSGAGVASISLPAGYMAEIISKGTTGAVTTWEVAFLGSASPNLGTALYLKATSNTNVPGGTGIIPVNFSNTPIYNSGDFVFNGATGVITVNTPGTYIATLQTSWTNISAAQQLTGGISDVSTGLWIGRGTHYSAAALSGTVGELLSVTSPLTLTAGQQVRFAVAAPAASTILAAETGATGTGTVTTGLLQRISN